MRREEEEEKMKDAIPHLYVQGIIIIIPVHPPFPLCCHYVGCSGVVAVSDLDMKGIAQILAYKNGGNWRNWMVFLIMKIANRIEN